MSSAEACHRESLIALEGANTPPVPVLIRPIGWVVAAGRVAGSVRLGSRVVATRRPARRSLVPTSAK